MRVGLGKRKAMSFLISFQISPRLMNRNRKLKQKGSSRPTFAAGGCCSILFIFITCVFHPLCRCDVRLSATRLPMPSSVYLHTTANSMTGKFSQEIPAALQPVATDNRSPVPGPRCRAKANSGCPRRAGLAESG